MKTKLSRRTSTAWFAIAVVALSLQLTAMQSQGIEITVTVHGIEDPDGTTSVLVHNGQTSVEGTRVDSGHTIESREVWNESGVDEDGNPVGVWTWVEVVTDSWTVYEASVSAVWM